MRGLLSDGARKSMEPMAARLGVDRQGLQQFLTDAPWSHRRTWSGRHHHVSLVSVAHAFCTLERLNPKAPAAV